MTYAPGPPLSRSEAEHGLFAAAFGAAEALHGNFFLAALSRGRRGQLGLNAAAGAAAVFVTGRLVRVLVLPTRPRSL